MPSPEVLDFAKLLAPISGEKPTGLDLRADATPTSAYYAIKDARTAARAAERQMVLGEDEASGTRPDWRPVLLHGAKALAEQTKDLEIAAYLIEALVRQHGFVGLGDGFRLARELIERFWDGLYPLPDEEGLETRLAALTGLNGDGADGTLLIPIAKIPITDGTNTRRFACAHYQAATALQKVADPKVREKKIAQGVVSMEIFEQAVADSAPQFYTNLVSDLKRCTEEFAKLCAALDKRCAGSAPPSSSIRTALESCLDIVKDVARGKLAVVPDKSGVSSDDRTPPADSTAGAAPDPGVAVDVIRTREDAFNTILKVATFFRRTEPHTIVSFALEQVVRWGRTPLPELLTELVPEEAPRKSLFKQVGIKLPELPPKSEPAKK